MDRPPIWNLKCDFCNTHTLCTPKHIEQKFYCGKCGAYLGQAVHEQTTKQETSPKELNSAEHNIIFYDTMFEYAQDADISHYRMSTPEEPEDMIISFGFQPCGDPDVSIDFNTRIQHNGDIYFPICWGENENSAIRENAVDESCYIRYIYNYNTMEYVSDGRIYDTREDAEAMI